MVDQLAPSRRFLCRNATRSSVQASRAVGTPTGIVSGRATDVSTEDPQELADGGCLTTPVQGAGSYDPSEDESHLVALKKRLGIPPRATGSAYRPFRGGLPTLRRDR